MNIEEFREYCLSKKGSTESFPFNETVLVFKVMDKMFALTDLDDEFRISLKCDPVKAVELRENYIDTVIPAFHMNNKHWNTIIMDGRIADQELKRWIDHSYDLVVSKLTKVKRQELENL